MKHTTTRRYITPITLAVVLILSTFMASVSSLFYSQTANADTPGWQAGNIIGEAVFTNPNTMSAGDIQNFLNSKVPSCDTWGTQTSELGGGTRRQWAEARGYSPPFTCLKDYSEHGKSAAQIIYETGHNFGINPQVLIVLLQKEQALITDTWPISVQYKTATGYGCPDHAPCGAEYFGFTNQIRWAARMFRAIIDDSPSWYTPYELGNNYIQYNPTASCGGSNVYIQNRSTQALYNYTPYQPSQSALDAPWGTTVSCGATGNLNFYRYFTSWFGSTQDSFSNLQMPRWMQVKNDTYKRSVGSGQQVDQLLPAGTQILMTTKISANGTTYLRTAHDTKGNESKGIRETDLKEIPYETISNPRWMNLNKNAYKQVPRAGLNVDGKLGEDRHMYFTSKITINGEVYVRTEHDTSISNDKAIPYEFLNDEVSFQPMGAPRWMEVSKPTHKKNVLTGATIGSPLNAGDQFLFKSKILVGDIWYLRNAADTDQNVQAGIPIGDAKEIPYVKLVEPRSLKLKSPTRKIDPYTGQAYDPQYETGKIIPFSSKIYVNGQWYLRSEVDTRSGVNMVIPMSALDELS